MSKFTLRLLENGNILVVGTGHGHGMVWVGILPADDNYTQQLRYKFGVQP